MKKRTLKLLAIISLVMLITLTGCSAMGGISSCFGEACAACFEKLGCVGDAMMYINPLYCACQVADCNFCDCSACISGPAYLCANCARSDCIEKATDDDDVGGPWLASAKIDFEKGDETFGNSKTYDYLNLDVSINIEKGGEKQMSCDGSDMRYTAKITVKNDSDYNLRNVYLRVLTSEFDPEYEYVWVGNIEKRSEGVGEYYIYVFGLTEMNWEVYELYVDAYGTVVNGIRAD